MTSVTSSLASAYHGARFFVCIDPGAPHYDINGNPPPVNYPSLGANLVVRDMGKTIRTPSQSVAQLVGPNTGPNTGPGRQLILRKVAVANSNSTVLPLTGAATNFVGFSEGGQDPNNLNNVFYINLYDGKWVSVSM